MDYHLQRKEHNFGREDYDLCHSVYSSMATLKNLVLEMWFSNVQTILYIYFIIYNSVNTT